MVKYTEIFFFTALTSCQCLKRCKCKIKAVMVVSKCNYCYLVEFWSTLSVSVCFVSLFVFSQKYTDIIYMSKGFFVCFFFASSKI